MKLINEELDGAIEEHKDSIKVIDGQIDHWHSRLEHLYEFIETKAIEPTRMAQRITEVQSKLEELRRARIEAEQALQAKRLEPIEPSTVFAYVQDLKCLLEESNILEGRAFLRSFIDRIEVDDGKITLNYTVPLPQDNSRQETLAVLGFVPPSPPYCTIEGTPSSSSIIPLDDIGIV